MRDVPISFNTLETSLGVFAAEWSAKGLLGLYFPGSFHARETLPPTPALRGSALAEDLENYLEGQPVDWRTPLDFGAATVFQRRVWQSIKTIPYGEVRSYGWLAEATDNPQALRAVANACGANPFPLLIPCHRVIASDGSLGGFSAGIAWKQKLLWLERESSHRSREPMKMDMPGVWIGSQAQGIFC